MHPKVADSGQFPFKQLKLKALSSKQPEQDELSPSHSPHSSTKFEKQLGYKSPWLGTQGNPGSEQNNNSSRANPKPSPSVSNQ